MRKIIQILIPLFILAECALAQTPVGASTTQATANASTLPRGTVIEAELSKGLNAKKSKQGDPVIARTTADVRSGNSVLIPAGSRVIGHVTQVAAHTKEQPESVLGIGFDRIELKHGEQMPLHAALQAVSSSQPASGGMQSPDMGPGMGSNAPMGGQSPMGRGGSGMPQMGTPTGAGQEGQNPVPGENGGTSPNGGLAGINAKGELTAQARGAIGMPGVALSNTTQGAVLNSKDSNVHLDGGTQLLLVSQ